MASIDSLARMETALRNPHSVEHGLGRQTPTLPVYLLWSLAERLTALGIDAKALCIESGLDIGELSNPACRVSIRQAAMLIRQAIRAVPGRPLGLETGSSETISSIGLLGYAMLTSPTLKEAVTLGIQMQRQSGAMMHFDKVEHAHRMSIVASSMVFDEEVEIFLTEEAFSSFMKLASALVGHDFRPAAIELSYCAPKWASKYDAIFQCPIRFASGHNAFHIDAVWSNRTIATHDVLAHRQVLELLCQAESAQESATGFIASLERTVRRNLRSVPALPDLAVAQGISERTLRRRLAHSGASYQVILDNVRRKEAMKLLRDPDLSIDSIADALGFSDARNFRRAFKRWTGYPPREHRP